MSGFDLTHSFAGSFSYEFPFGKWKSFNPSNKVLGYLADGWQLNAIGILHSGTAYDVIYQGDLANTGHTFVRVNLVGDRTPGHRTPGEWMMNSVDAMNDVDGTREIAIQSRRGENGQVLVSVSDTGVGLPPQQVDKIFNAFFTTKTHGTGMGLRISRSIIESNGGRLWAVDNSRRGARFYFALPASVLSH